ncbi:MAG TPA: DUF1707 domain-containing protein [Mycobacteriales bacterium]|nr:DUF1707 domain-containing protein [Mycobacteriales bacterium]
MPDHGRELTGPDVRIGDREREAALAALGEHLTAGRITLDEYGDRSAIAATAATRGALTTLFEDLPEPHPDLGGASGVSAVADLPAAPPVPGEPGVPAVRRSGLAPGPRAVAAGIAVMWAVGVPLIFIAGLPWWLVFLPTGVSIFARRFRPDRGHHR